jgi:hypothetical protein
VKSSKSGRLLLVLVAATATAQTAKLGWVQSGSTPVTRVTPVSNEACETVAMLAPNLGVK